MNTPGTTLVIGATGTTGRRVTAGLTAAGHRAKAAGRTAAPVVGADGVRFDWNAPSTWEPVLEGADRAYLVPPVGSPNPAEVMLPFLRLAQAAGVRRAVLLSSSAIPAGGPAVGQVHQALPGLFDEWAVLRPSWFMQNFAGSSPHGRSIRNEGAIMSATGEGRVGFVDAQDIAAVAVRALTDDRAPNTDLVLTGPQTLSHADVAAILTEVTGRPVVHRQLTFEQVRDRWAAEIPLEFATLLAEMDRAIAAGAEDRTSDTVERLTGRPPGTFRAFVRREVTYDEPQPG
ncbi:ergot alkaloid biosynthesis protein [Streptomyces bambusae]|uniref:NmrA family NAD(P)-binding protein n=1 Tax=Streptomyces bambusae TaxID=1550616 RepID=UPI001CFD979B|nr:ergot alkaloid biosynthesis protein [Streptomyces bambusae]MCB5167354.1 ergot alkaloid biosynthesis protein [Streptomyces bambusae]